MILEIGYQNTVAAQKVVAVLGYESAPVKRLVTIAKENGLFIDATKGHKTLSVVVMEGGFIVSTARRAQTLSAKLNAALQSRFGSYITGELMSTTEDEFEDEEDSDEDEIEDDFKLDDE